MSSIVSDHFILLPPRGTIVEGLLGTRALKSFMLRLNDAQKADRAVAVRAGAARAGLSGTAPKMRVLDSLHENGAKLVQMPPEAAAALRAEQPGLRLAPLVHYRKADAPRPKILEQFRTAARTTARAARGPQVGRLKLKMLIQGTTLPAVGADVLVFTNYANRVGAEGKSNKRGEVTLALGPDPVRVQKLFIYPASGCWSLLKQNISLASGQQFTLRPLDLSFTDVLRHFHGNAPLNVGQGVKVAVVDSGVNRHHDDLTVAGGRCTVAGEILPSTAMSVTATAHMSPASSPRVAPRRTDCEALRPPCCSTAIAFSAETAKTHRLSTS